MSDPVTAARTAREALARGLNALQSDPNVPPQLLELAAPIAQAMGALHAIERSNGTQLLPHAEVALANTRNALSQLQSQPPTHVAVSQAMEAVAMSLASVHALSPPLPRRLSPSRPLRLRLPWPGPRSDRFQPRSRSRFRIRSSARPLRPLHRPPCRRLRNRVFRRTCKPPCNQAFNRSCILPRPSATRPTPSRPIRHLGS